MNIKMKGLVNWLLTTPIILSPVYGLVMPRKHLADYFQPIDPAHRIDDEYGVLLQDNHTLNDHFNFIGMNLEQTAPMFHWIRSINGYRAKLDRDTVHNLIRHDPGVLSVEEDTTIEPITYANKGEEFHDSSLRKTRLTRRYEQCHQPRCHWWMTMIQAGKKVALTDEDPCVRPLFSKHYARAIFIP
jgi:hypothetical protein